MMKIIYLLMVFLFGIGVAGGIGYTVFYGDYFISVGILVSGYMGLPKMAEYLKKITE